MNRQKVTLDHAHYHLGSCSAGTGSDGSGLCLALGGLFSAKGAGHCSQKLVLRRVPVPPRPFPPTFQHLSSSLNCLLL